MQMFHKQSYFNFAYTVTAQASINALHDTKGMKCGDKITVKPPIQEMRQIIKQLQLVQKAASPNICLNSPWNHTFALY